MISGRLSGSWNSSFFTGYSLIGSFPEQTLSMSFVNQDSPASGDMIGNTNTGSFDGSIFQGIIINGLLTGGVVSIPFTGSYSYVTSSFTTTSSVTTTGSSFQILDTNKPFVVIFQNLQKEYSFGDIPRINLFSREQFPIKTFEKTHQQISHITPRLLPSSSFYSIKDNETEEIIIDFDNYTKLSCDLDGHYFILDTTGFEKERYYKILILINCDNGNSYTFDSNNLFQIRR